MKKNDCRHAAAWAAAMEQLCANDTMRRDWLWLRACEREDEASRRMLERADPDLRRRMESIRASTESLASRRLRRECYGLMMDQLLASCAAELDTLECPCASCTAEQPGDGNHHC